MTTEEIIRRLEKLEEQHDKDHDNIIKNKYELQDIMTKVVKEGNKDIITMINKLEDYTKTKLLELETRVFDLENQKAKLALERWNAIKMATRNWFILGVLTQLPWIVKEFINMLK